MEGWLCSLCGGSSVGNGAEVHVELSTAALTISVVLTTRGTSAESSEAATGLVAVGRSSWMVGMVRFDETMVD